MAAELHIAPRYHRWHVDPDVDWVETNTGYADLDWTIPLGSAALVLVDIWKGHYLADTEARINDIARNRIVPLLDRARDAGMPIIHAPEPSVAKRQPGWVGLVETMPAPVDSEWPPSDFRQKNGAFAQYKRPIEPREPELDELRRDRPLHPDVQPEVGEPVVANGEELHRVCKERGILFLFFLGFNTNACILLRDYGTLAMASRGYEVVLVRDCTTGMESAQSQSGLQQTNGAILFLEMFRAYSVTSRQIVDGFTDV